MPSSRPTLLEEHHFRLYAQPISTLASNSCGFHCELLLRLQDDHENIVAPGVFMPAAERYHLTVQIDRWVVGQALRWLAAHPLFLKQLTLCAINLSGHSVSDRLFQSYVMRQFEKNGVPAHKICFEITETAAMANLTDTLYFITTLRSLGCCFALDDFGSGLSSFGYLKNLPVDFLKIDGMFVKDMVDNPIDFAMVRSINEIGQLMGKKTIAEYVENDRIFNSLQQLGINYGQGYGIGYPLPLEEWAESIEALPQG